MLTTCIHGNNWKIGCKTLECIERCDKDNAFYDKWDYWSLMTKSTFCLVPRGRRLGTFRFLEAIKAGCIPIVMANGWVLPFSEKIDWSRAVITWDERLFTDFEEIINAISKEEIYKMKQQIAWLYSAYFSSFEQIITTTLEIIKDRIFFDKSRNYEDWNNWPGALIKMNHFTDNYPLKTFSPIRYFTTVIYVTEANAWNIYKQVDAVEKSGKSDQIFILWASTSPAPENPAFQSMKSVVLIQNLELIKTASSKFINRDAFKNQYVSSKASAKLIVH